MCRKLIGKWTGICLVSASAIALDLRGLYAAEGVSAEEEIVVTATRTPRPLDVTGSTSVVTRPTLSDRGGADIAAALDELEGVEVLRYGGPGSVASVHIRGTYGVHTLVLADGRTLNSSTLGSADISEISPVLVEKIEVVRGGASQLYGAGAVGGVVQVFTREAPSEPMRELGLELGSFETVRGSFILGGPMGAQRGIFGVDIFSTEGHRPNSYLDSAELMGKLVLGSEGSPRTTISVGARAAEMGLPGPVPAPGVTPPYGNDEVTSLVDNAKATSGYLQVAHERGDLKLRASFSSRLDDTHQEWQDFLSNHIAQDTAIAASRPEFEANYSWSAGPAKFLFGMGFAHDRADFDTEEKNLTGGTSTTSTRFDWRTSWAAWGQVELSQEGRDLIAGVRWDEPSDYSGRASGRLTCALGHQPLRFEATVSSAFRAPSLNDLNWPAGPYASGNPNLDPEESLEAELAILWSNGPARVRAAAFSKRVDGLIQWSPDAGGVWRPDNLGQADIAGLELSASLHLVRGLKCRLAYTYLDATDTSTRLTYVNYSLPDPYLFEEMERKLAYTPDHQLELSLDWSTLVGWLGSNGEFSASLYASWVSGLRQYYEDWVEVTPFTEYDVVYREKELSDPWVVGLRVAWKVARKEFFLRVDNLLDVEYARQFGYSINDGDYPMPGRTVTVGCKLGF